MNHLLNLFLPLLLLVLVFPLAPGQTRGRTKPKRVDVMTDEQMAIELPKLRQLSVANKAKVRKALNLLNEAFLTATVSTDMEEIAEDGTEANAAVDAAEAVIPNGALKGTLRSCNKALGHSYYLRLVSSGGLDADEPEVARVLEEIMIRYQLARIPQYSRPAKVLDFAGFHLTMAKDISFRAGLISERPE